MKDLDNALNLDPIMDKFSSYLDAICRINSIIIEKLGYLEEQSEAPAHIISPQLTAQKDDLNTILNSLLENLTFALETIATTRGFGVAQPPENDNFH